MGTSTSSPAATTTASEAVARFPSPAVSPRTGRSVQDGAGDSIGLHCRLRRLAETADDGVPVLKPLRQPDPLHVGPVHYVREHPRGHDVPVIGSAAAVPALAVKQNSNTRSIGFVLTGEDQVDSEVGQANVGAYAQAALAQGPGDVVAVPVGERRSCGVDWECGRTVLSEQQVTLEIVQTNGGAALGLEPGRVEGAEEDHLLAGARDGDVEPPFAALPVEGAEIERYLPVLPRREGHGEEDRVALVALNVLEVLNEHAIVGVQ